MRILLFGDDIHSLTRTTWPHLSFANTPHFEFWSGAPHFLSLFLSPSHQNCLKHRNYSNTLERRGIVPNSNLILSTSLNKKVSSVRQKLCVWSAVHNKIVSCSLDRNAFVWTYDNDTKKWIPALVILRIDRGAFDVKWSSDGLRFGVTSGAKCVPVCTYDESNNW
jgi:hypothetical protein